MHKLTEREAAYIAGLADGEGWVGVHTQHQEFKTYHYPIIEISQNDRTPLDWIMKITGIGRVHAEPREGKETRHKYVVKGKKALDLLEAIEDDLIVKADQAGFILERFGR